MVKFIKEAANMTLLKKINFESMKKNSYQEAKEKICQIPGVGNKVADCVLLFSLNKLEAFPLDRWMIRILEKYYSKQFQLETKTITEKQYEILHEKIVNVILVHLQDIHNNFSLRWKEKITKKSGCKQILVLP